MRYKVVFVKLDELSRSGSQSKPPDGDVLIRSPKPKLQQFENMIIAKNPDNFVERKNALNKMVNSETPEDFIDNDQKGKFQYQVPRVRASFTLKVAPDSTTADLPEPTLESANSTNDKTPSTVKYGPNAPSGKASLPEYGPHLPDTDSVALDKPVRDFRPRVPAQPAILNSIPKVPKPILAHRSTYNVSNDDKDFEIPLEESLRAVEEFIKREKELSKWQIGEDVLAKWKGNGLYYKANILDMFPSGIVVVLFDSYAITDEIDHKDLCKFFRKTNNFKKKGRSQEKLTVDTEERHDISAKKQVKAKKRRRVSCKRLCFISVFKRSDMLRKKLLLSYQKKSHALPKIKSKRRAQKATMNKKVS